MMIRRWWLARNISINLAFLMIVTFLLTDRSSLVKANNTTAQLVLVASSPFQMILSPTATELTFADLRLVEEAAAQTLRRMQSLQSSSSTTTTSTTGEEEYVNLQVIIQQSQFLPINGSEYELPAAQLRLFALATIYSDDSTTSSRERQARLNRLLEDTFTNSTGINIFLQLLKGNADLTEVTTVVLAPIVPSYPTPNTSTTKKPKSKLSTVDIILIVVSGLIFLGILYMVIEHHKDRGYIENLRLRALNGPAPRPDEQHAHEDYKDDTMPTDEEAPSTPSTAGSGLVEFDVAPETPPQKVRISVHPENEKAPEQVMLSTSNEASSVHTLAEPFDSKWFQPSSGYPPVPEDQKEEIVLEETGSQDSVDVFGIDVDACCSGSNLDDEKSRSTAAATAISDWMKTIRVVPSDNKTSEMTQSSQEHSSAEPSLDPSSSLEQSSLEQLSLEQSMASSTVSDRKRSRRPEKVEV